MAAHRYARSERVMAEQHTAGPVRCDGWDRAING